MKTTIYLLAFIIFFFGCSFKSSQQGVTSTDLEPIRNPIVDYNNYLDSIIKKENPPHITLYEYRSTGKLGKRISISDEQIIKRIISNLFVDESLFKVNEEGKVPCYKSACMPDVTITINDSSYDNEEFNINYYMEECSPGEIQAPILWCQRPLDKVKAKQLSIIFKELGLIE